jgi:hypothetical protein
LWLSSRKWNGSLRAGREGHLERIERDPRRLHARERREG